MRAAGQAAGVDSVLETLGMRCPSTVHWSSFRARTGHARPRFTPAARSMSEQTYDDGRARNLEALLLALAERIRELHQSGTLLSNAGELTRMIGEVRSELFHYEVRATYDTPDVAESRRIVSEAQKNEEAQWEQSEWRPDEDDEPDW